MIRIFAALAIVAAALSIGAPSASAQAYCACWGTGNVIQSYFEPSGHLVNERESGQKTGASTSRKYRGHSSSGR